MIFLPARWPEGLLAWLLFRPGSCAAEAKVVLRDSYIDHGNLEPRALEAALGHTPPPLALYVPTCPFVLVFWVS